MTSMPLSIQQNEHCDPRAYLHKSRESVACSNIGFSGIRQRNPNDPIEQRVESLIYVLAGMDEDALRAMGANDRSEIETMARFCLHC